MRKYISVFGVITLTMSILYVSSVGAAQKMSGAVPVTGISDGSSFSIAPLFGIKFFATKDNGANGQPDSRVEKPVEKPDLRTVDWYQGGNGADRKTSSDGNGDKENDDDDEKDDDDDKEPEGFDRLWDVVTLG